MDERGQWRHFWLVLILAATFTIGFYALLPQVPFLEQTVHRYCCAHWVEYTSMGLFWLGVASLLVKGMHTINEKKALARHAWGELSLKPVESISQAVEEVSQRARLLGPHLATTEFMRRLQYLCRWLALKVDAEGIDAVAQRLQEQAEQRLAESYTLVKTITWAIPILGFLGTVIGITLAVANITPEQLENSLNDVTAGLAVAFDTTALSLILSIILVFLSFVIERRERHVLSMVNAEINNNILPFFLRLQQPSTAPTQQLHQEFMRKLLEQSERLLRMQLDAWHRALHEFRDRWISSLEQQCITLSADLGQAFKQGCQKLLDEAWTSQREHQRRWGESLAQIHHDLTDELSLHRQQHEQMLMTWTGSLQETCQRLIEEGRRWEQMWSENQLCRNMEVREWHLQLSQATSSLNKSAQLLQQQCELLSVIASQGGALHAIHQQLHEQLQTAKIAATLEDNLLHLNAAIQMLTSRVSARAA